MVTGRPSKYLPPLIEKAHNYLTEYENLGEVYPSIAGLAVYLGIRRETVWAWANDSEKEEFSNIVSDLLARQESNLTNKGLSGQHNSSICKLLLSKHGYHDKSELFGKDGEPLIPKHTDEEAARRIAYLWSQALGDKDASDT
ncbi:MAG: terminase small subunit [bacterium]